MAEPKSEPPLGIAPYPAAAPNSCPFGAPPSPGSAGIPGSPPNQALPPDGAKPSSPNPLFAAS